MVVILITVLGQNNMSRKCFITFLNTTAQTERSDSNPRLQPRCLRSSHTSLLRRKVASGVPPPPDVSPVEQEIQQVESMLPKLLDRGAALFLLAHDYARLGNLARGFSLLKECMSVDEGFDPE